ncbi:Uncharacterized protein APZ42_002315, partial [Daphnia magna]
IANDPARDRHQLPDIKFMSHTSLFSWRLVIHSAIGLVEELFSAGLNVLLTGRFIQHPIEVNDDYPTAHSWLHIFRILSLYNPTKVAIRNANVDGRDAGEVLVAYKQCLINKFRDCETKAKEIKKDFKDSLQKELLLRYTNDILDGKSDATRYQLVYDLCGYIIRTRHEVC